jgi:deoxyribonuclease V
MTPIPDEWLLPPTLEAATQVQRELAARVVAEDDFGPIAAIAGTDISSRGRDPSAPVHAAVVVLSLPDLAVREVAGSSMQPRFPYVPGYLGFRESPSLVEAFGRLKARPDLLFVDGQGLSHPRGFGIACQLGVLLDMPAIGVAKSILVGKPERELGPLPGDHVPLVWRGRTVGAAVRTKRRTNPLYVSVGHRIALDTAIEWVLRATRGYRLPEPTRQAHLAANVIRREADLPTP